MTNQKRPKTRADQKDAVESLIRPEMMESAMQALTRLAMAMAKSLAVDATNDDNPDTILARRLASSFQSDGHGEPTLLGTKAPQSDNGEKALDESVIPFLKEIERQLPQGAFYYGRRDQLQSRAVWLTIQHGSTTTTIIITITFEDRVTVTAKRREANGRVVEPKLEQFISRPEDLTAENLFRLIATATGYKT
jgi:hypothetical protein